MQPRLRSLESLKVFVYAAKYLNFSSAANELNITPGAVSQRIKQLELDLGVLLFKRERQRVALTSNGLELFSAANQAFSTIEFAVERIAEPTSNQITIGASTYFSSRWLSRRLLSFMEKNPNIFLNLKPINSMGGSDAENLDICILWGRGQWANPKSILLFESKMTLICGKKTYDTIKYLEIQNQLKNIKFLKDEETQEAWNRWINLADIQDVMQRLPSAALDPNVRIQAVIDDQGVALADKLVQPDIDSGRLFFPTSIELDGYGYYLVSQENKAETDSMKLFKDWVISEALSC